MHVVYLTGSNSKNCETRHLHTIIFYFDITSSDINKDRNLKKKWLNVRMQNQIQPIMESNRFNQVNGYPEGHTWSNLSQRISKKNQTIHLIRLCHLSLILEGVSNHKFQLTLWGQISSSESTFAKENNMTRIEEYKYYQNIFLIRHVPHSDDKLFTQNGSFHLFFFFPNSNQFNMVKFAKPHINLLKFWNIILKKLLDHIWRSYQQWGSEQERKVANMLSIPPGTIPAKNEQSNRWCSQK